MTWEIIYQLAIWWNGWVFLFLLMFSHDTRLLYLGTPSLFLSPAAAVFLLSSVKGVASGGQVFHPTSTLSFMQNLLPCTSLGNFYTKAPEWIESSAQLVSRSWLVAKTGRFPFSGDEKLLLFKDHVLCSVWHCIALYAKGSPKLMEKKNCFTSELLQNTNNLSQKR